MGLKVNNYVLDRLPIWGQDVNLIAPAFSDGTVILDSASEMTASYGINANMFVTPEFRLWAFYYTMGTSSVWFPIICFMWLPVMTFLNLVKSIVVGNKRNEPESMPKVIFRLK